MFRNKVKEAVEIATKAHIETTVLKRFKTSAACSKHIREMFEYSSNRDHDPFLWRCWEVTDVPTGYRKPTKTKGVATKTPKDPKSARLAAKGSAASKSEYCIISITALVSSVLQDADHLSTASLSGPLHPLAIDAVLLPGSKPVG